MRGCARKRDLNESAIADELKALGADTRQIIREASETKQAAPTTGARRKSL